MTPQVGDYAFTTLRPQLGTIRYADGARLTLADVPGLLEGAHAGRGRGAAFLAHLSRAGCLVYVLDLSGGTPDALVREAPGQQLQVLQVRAAQARAC